MLLTREEIEKLNIGDEVVYKEKDGHLSNTKYLATVVEKHSRFLVLSCLANENTGQRFRTSFNYDDAVFYSGSILLSKDEMGD